jgi:hypothetical protein
MAVTFQPDPLVAGLNSFASVSYGDDFFAKRLHDTTWTTAVQATKEAALMWATIQLSQLGWKGVKTNPASTVSWPRKGVSYSEWYEPQSLDPTSSYDSFGYVSSTRTIADTEIPFEVKDACCELAMSLISSDTTVPKGTEGFKSIKVDSISLEMLPNDRLAFFTANVKNLCSKFLLNSSPYNIPVTRV